MLRMREAKAKKPTGKAEDAKSQSRKSRNPIKSHKSQKPPTLKNKNYPVKKAEEHPPKKWPSPSNSQLPTNRRPKSQVRLATPGMRPANQPTQPTHPPTNQPTSQPTNQPTRGPALEKRQALGEKTQHLIQTINPTSKRVEHSLMDCGTPAHRSLDIRGTGNAPRSAPKFWPKEKLETHIP